MLKRLIGPSNRRVRLLVGLLLIGLFCVLGTTQTTALRTSHFATFMAGKQHGQTSSSALTDLKELAQTNPIALLEYCLRNARREYTDYTCTFIKQERINGKLLPEQHIRVRFMKEPFSVAMAWVKNAGRGDRALYVYGQHKGNMLVRPTSKFLRGLAGSAVQRKPTHRDVMKSTLRPITMFGFERSLESLLELYRKGAENGDLTSRFVGWANVAGREAMVLRRDLPAKADYPSGTTFIYIDADYLVPIMVEGYDWSQPKQLLCRYVFKDIRFNVGLTAEDFTLQANDMK